MAVTINASTTAGLVQTADTTGNLSLQSNGTTIAALTSAGLAVTGAGTFSTTLVVNGNVTLGDAVGDVHTTNGLVQIGQGTFAARTGVKGVIAAGSDLGSIHCQLGDSGGTWQWINAANSLGVMILDNAGALSVTGTLGVGGYSAYVCRAWVNFNGTGTVAINGSQNVSSITDNGTGDYTVNFTVSMANALYTAVGSCSAQANSYAAFVTMNRNNGGAYVAPTAAAQRLNTLDHQSYAAADNQNVSVAIII